MIRKALKASWIRDVRSELVARAMSDRTLIRGIAHRAQSKPGMTTLIAIRPIHGLNKDTKKTQVK